MRDIRYRLGLTAFLVMICLSSFMEFAQATEKRETILWKLPAGAIQPQAAVDSKGVVHLIYFRNGASEGTGNLYYSRLSGKEIHASSPLKINSVPDTAGSVGTVRTAQIAIGKGDRVHVVWNGLGRKGSNGYPTAYQAYARMNDGGTAFEPQRNLTTWAFGLDGGGTVAADGEGNVYVAWHASVNAKEDAGRAVFVSRSDDNGATFSREKQANPELRGACACCGMRAFVDGKGTLYLLYRAAAKNIERDTMLLVSKDKGAAFTEKRLDKWDINACPMSTYSLADSANGILATWETSGRVYYGPIKLSTMSVSMKMQVPGASQKHPFITTASNGESLLVWTEGTGWQRGGSLNWILIDNDGKMGTGGRLEGAIPVWGLATAFPRPSGGFVIVY